MLGMRKDNAVPNATMVLREAVVISQHVLPTGGKQKANESKVDFDSSTISSLLILTSNLLARRASEIHELLDNPASVTTFGC